MPDDPFRKLTPGETLDGIPAAAWNSFLDAAAAHKAASGAFTGRFLAGGSDGVIRVRNDTGHVLAQYDIAEPLAPLFNPATTSLAAFKRDLIIRVVLPTVADFRPRPFVVAQERIGIGKIGLAKIAGITPVKVDWIVETDDYVDLIHAEKTKVRSSPCGSARIVVMETAWSSRADKWGYVQLGVDFSGLVFGKAVNDIPKRSPSSADFSTADGFVQVYRLTGSPLDAVHTLSIGDFFNVYNRFGFVGAGKWVLCGWSGRAWHIVTAEC